MKKITKIAIGISAFILVASNLSSKDKSKNSIYTPERIVFGNSEDSVGYEESVTMKMTNGYPSYAYKTENVYLLVDKETREVTEYLFVTSEGTNQNWFERVLYQEGETVNQIFEIPSGDLICYYYSEFNGQGLDYIEYLLEKSDLIPLKDLEIYLEESPKEWYSIREIRELEPQIVDAYDKINRQVKRLEKKNNK